ncbi:MAG: DUF2793 domain-containing protein [Paracoccaceae bacterium]
MPDDTPILSMPYIMPAQAQKHVTHNEALRVLDVIVQLVVQDRTRTEPPDTAQESDRHIVAAAATGLWSGQGGKIALREHGQWSFFVPLAGWQAHVLDEGATVTFDGTVWQSAAQQPLEVAQLGISATPDGVNRLSVNASATLLNHAGGGHQLKINKAAAVDTASLLFQSAFSGHAEMGLAGTNDFSLKVSADGSVWTEALRCEAATGRVSLEGGAVLPDGSAATPSVSFAGDGDTGLFRSAANQLGAATGGAMRWLLSNTGLHVNVPISGTAVTQTNADTTTGRVLKVGDYGLGVIIGSYTADIDSISVNGLYRLNGGAFSTASPTPALGAGWILSHREWNVGTAYQTLELPNGEVYVRRKSGTWGAFHRDYNANTIIGAVSQSGGVPTGRIIERGSNANGEYVRFADGTQICTFAMSSAASVNTVWTFPAGFGAAPSGVSAIAGATSVRCPALAAVTTSNLEFNLYDTSNVRVSGFARLTAIGRWF